MRAIGAASIGAIGKLYGNCQTNETEVSTSSSNPKMTILKPKRILRRAVLCGVLVAGARLLPAQARPWTLLLAPKPPAYPDKVARPLVTAQAEQISDGLERYVEDWMDGRVSARIPDNLVPQGNDFTAFKTFTLVRPEQVTPDQQWVVRPAQPIRFDAILGQFPDPHCTYLYLPFLAPFGSRVVMEGEFPHSRFFSIQPTPAFAPDFYKLGAGGVPEVPLLDADIEPLPGHTNPFRVGADRQARKRSWRATFDVKIGDPVALNGGAFTPPYYRAPGNNRAVGAIFYQGPGAKEKDWRRRFDIGQIWVRYYAPDTQTGPLAGVPLPRVWYELPDGRRYFVKVDFSTWASRINRTQPAPQSAPTEPAKGIGPGQGWSKQWGILRSIYGGIAGATGLVDKRWAREYDLGMNGRGEDLAAPNNYEQSATTCIYINYLTRAMSLGAGKVMVLEGQMPTYPDTRGGAKTMTGAQMRYWSLSGYDIALPQSDGYTGAVLVSLMDDEIVLDKERRYMIVLSRAEDRPRNATRENGVTWANWGQTGTLAFTLRWMSIAPQWTFPLAPDEDHLRRETDVLSKNYDQNVIGRNNRAGFLGDYQPVVHYLSRGDFERLGRDFGSDDLPAWK